MTNEAPNTDDVEKQADVDDVDDADKVPEGTHRRYVKKHEQLKVGRVKTNTFKFGYLLVPASWMPSSGSLGEYVEEIFQALKMIQPKLVFNTMTIDNDEFVKDDAAYRGVAHFLKEISEQCGKDGAYYLLHRPILANSAIEKIILEENADITLLHFNLYSEDKQDKEMWEKDKEIWFPGGGGDHEVSSLSKRLKECATTINERRKFEVEFEVEWDPNLPDSLRRVIFFERAKDRRRFARCLEQKVPVGMLVCGGSYDGKNEVELMRLLDLLRKGRPLLIFRHTNGIAHCLASLVDAITRKKYKEEKKKIEKSLKTKRNETKVSKKLRRLEDIIKEQEKEPMNEENVDEARQKEDDDNTAERRKKRRMEDSEERRKKFKEEKKKIEEYLKTKRKKSEISEKLRRFREIETWLTRDKGSGRAELSLKDRCYAGHPYLDPTPENYENYGKTVENYDKKVENYGKMVSIVQNFYDKLPRDYNKSKAVMVIDPIKDNPSEKLEEIIGVMAAQYDAVPDFGGEVSEELILRSATYEINRLGRLEKRERVLSWALKLLIFFFTFSTTALSCTFTFVNNIENSSSSVQAASPYLKATTIIFPILLSICLAIYTKFSPMSRISKFKLARAQVKRILYCYRCRVGKFRAKVDEGPVHRSNFTAELYLILKPFCVDEMTKYSMFSRTVDDSSYDSKEWSLLTAEEYVQDRIVTSLSSLERKLSRLSIQLRILEISIIAFTASTAIMSAYDLQLWIPAVLAFVAVLESLCQFRHLSRRIETANITISRIRESYYGWWCALTPFQRKFPENKQRLVDEVEEAILDRVIIIAESIKITEKQMQDESKTNNGSA